MMKVPFFRLKLGTFEKQAVAAVLESGWVTSGPAVGLFEEYMKVLTGARHAVAVSSGTAGLHLALIANKIGPGDEVITTPFTMAATIEAILYAGAMPVFADIDPVTMNIDAEAADGAITRKTKAILAVDMAGWPCDYDRLRAIARRSGIRLIADAAHSLGGSYRGRPIGAVADTTVFSFYSTKNITTGEGGMLVTGSKPVAERARHLALHGMTSSGWKRYSGGSWKYDITDLGYKYNMSDLAAGLGLGQLARFPKLQKKRQLLAKRYCDRLNDLRDYIDLPYTDNGAEHAWHLFIVRIKTNRWRIGRDRLIEELEKKGIGCGVHFIPIYRLSYFRKNLNIDMARLKRTEETFHRVISLPFYPDLGENQVGYVCRKIHQLAEEFGR